MISVISRIIGGIAVIMLIVVIHELGHYLIGRWCGIKAAVFSVGFGPEICAVKDKSGTRWRLAALPLGGYVRFVGDEGADSAPAAKNGAAEAAVKGAFSAAGAWQKAATVFAGPLFNGLLAVLILAFMAFHFGKYTIAPVVSSVLPDSPAAAAGLRPGDRFLTMNGAKIISFDDISRYVMTHEYEPVSFMVERQGQPLKLVITPELTRADDGFGNIIKVGRIGVIGSNDRRNISRRTYSAAGALVEGLRDTGLVAQQTGQYLIKLVRGRGDRCQLSGPVRTAEIAWQVSDIGFWALLQLAALLSAGIGLFNLLPLPPLDGGHLLFYLLEGITGCAVPVKIQEIIFRAGWILILLFTVFAILNNAVPC